VERRKEFALDDIGWHATENFGRDASDVFVFALDVQHTTYDVRLNVFDRRLVVKGIERKRAEDQYGRESCENVHGAFFVAAV
jgi:hypothetical protein